LSAKIQRKKANLRTLPLIPDVEKLLLEVKKKEASNHQNVRARTIRNILIACVLMIWVIY
jgi:hypothetical protein